MSRRAARVGLAAAAAVSPMTGYLATPAGAAALSFGPPAAWPTAFTSYTTGGAPIRDASNAGSCVDPSTGGSAPTGANDIFSGTPSDCAISSLGPLPSAYYHYDAALDIYFFRFRVAGNPLRPNASSGGTLNNQDPFDPITYNLLIDTDGDGYKEFTAVLNGNHGSNGTAYDRIEIYYADTGTQQVAAEDLVASGPAATVTSGYRSGNVSDFGPTRVTDESAVGGGYLIDFQVPGNAFVNGAGEDLISAATPMSFFFTTATSNVNPLQKDAAYAGLLNATGRVPGGDTVVGDTIVAAPITSSIGLSGACPDPTSLAARLQDGFSVTGGSTITTTVQSVVFEYTLDADGNSVPDSNAWVQLASAVQPSPVSDPSLWTATFNATALPAGVRVLIRVTATDTDGNVGYSAFDPPAPGLPNRFATFTSTSACFPPPPPGSPTANPDAVTTPEDTPLTMNVLANDVGTGPLEAVSATAPARGTLVCDSAGSCTYTPNPNFSGTDSFTYLMRDSNGLEATGSVTVTVTPVNDAPVGVDDGYTTGEDTTLLIAAPGVLANDTDVDGDTLTVTGHTAAAHGTVTLNPNGSFTYTPNADFNGTDSFTYTVSDGTVTDTATVTIVVRPVNDVPVAIDDAYATDEDTLLVVPVAGVLINDTDVDGDTLTVTGHTPAAHGTVTLNPNGSFTYTPDADFNGTDSFTYTVSDGTVTDTATVTIVVSPVEEAEVVAPTSPASPTEIVPEVLSGASEIATPASVSPRPAAEMPRADASAAPVQPRSGELPRTGADPRQLSQFGALLVLLGSAARRAARPRRQK